MEEDDFQPDFKWIRCETRQNNEILFVTYQFKVEEMLNEIYYVKENNSWNLLIHCESGIAMETIVLYAVDKYSLDDIKKQSERRIISYMQNMKTKLEQNIKSMNEICGPFMSPM